MTIRRVLVPYADGATQPFALRAALTVGRRFDAHIDVFFIRADPRAEVLMQRAEAAGMVEQFLESVRASEDRLAADAHRRFLMVCTETGVSPVDRPATPAHLGAAWREVAGNRDLVVRTMAEEARLSDLIVLARPTAASRDEFIAIREAILLSSGRAILTVPADIPGNVGDVVAVCWNGRVEAARAVACALPFLSKASTVHIITAETSRTPAGEGQRLATYLALHGVEATVTAPTLGLGGGVGKALIEQARSLGADLLVMGGYGHSRVREILLGGVTRHVLEHADMPVLMVH